jgi:hypothetical protein
MISETSSLQRDRRIVLLCGIPGSGKTTYSRWLAQQKAFDHLDFDELLSGTGTPTQLKLIGLLKTSPRDFVHKLSRRAPTVIDWGFSLASIALIRELQQRGISVWWFDGDREAALQSFIARGTVSLEAFRNQMGAIEKGWNQIKAVIGNRVINAVAAGPTHLAPEKIFVEMFGSGK